MADVTHNYGSEQQWLATLSIASIPANPGVTLKVGDTIVFDKFSGGDVTAAVNKHRPGGMKNEITYMSLPTYSDVVLTKVYETQVDHDKIKDLHALAGKAMVNVAIQALDDEGNVYESAKARTYSGRLVNVKDGGTDSMSNAARMYEIDIAVESVSN
jgi:signal peptidase I